MGRSPAPPPSHPRPPSFRDAIAGTARNPAGVTTLGFSAEPTYDQAQFQAVIDKVNELIAATVR